MSLLDQILQCSGCTPQEAQQIADLGNQTSQTVNVVCQSTNDIASEVADALANMTLQLSAAINNNALTISSQLSQLISALNRDIQQITDSLNTQLSIIANEFLLTLRVQYPSIVTNNYYGNIVTNYDESQTNNTTNSTTNNTATTTNTSDVEYITNTSIVQNDGGIPQLGNSPSGLPNANCLCPGQCVPISLMNGCVINGVVVIGDNGLGISVAACPQPNLAAQQQPQSQTVPCTLAISLAASDNANKVGIAQLNGYVAYLELVSTSHWNGPIFVKGGYVALIANVLFDGTAYSATLSYDNVVLWKVDSVSLSGDSSTSLTLGPANFSEPKNPPYGMQLIQDSDKVPVQLAMTVDLSDCIQQQQTGISSSNGTSTQDANGANQQYNNQFTTCPAGQGQIQPDQQTGQQMSSDVVSIQEPEAFKFQQRTQPWYRSAVSWDSSVLQPLDTAQTLKEYIDGRMKDLEDAYNAAVPK